MALVKLTRLSMRLASGKEGAAIFIRAENLEAAHRDFLRENGIVLTDDVFDYDFPAFYDGKDVENVKKTLGDSVVYTGPRGWVG